jgi:tripartite-type tricarboxylate transporter receptor subunit TctC
MAILLGSNFMKRLAISTVVVATMAMGGTAVQADSFYDGKTVRIVVPSGSGGTYHLYCQILSRYLGKHLGKDTTVVTQNMPGAGGVKAARYMLNAAPKDGSYISMINPGSIALPGLRKDVGFETLKMDWLGSMSGRAYTVGVFHESGVKTVADAQKREVIMGTSGKASTSYLIPAFMNKTVGTKFKIITGYKGGGAINLAMQKKEIEGRGNFYTGYLGVWPEAVRDNQVIFLARLGPERPDIQHIPRLRDMMKTERQREMLDILEVSFNVGQAFYAPNDLPPGRLQTLRKAFMATVKDPATIAEAKKRFLPMRSQTHDDVLKSIEKVFNKPPQAFAQLADMLGFNKKKKKK